jgi:hypothetical protein
MAHLVGEYDAYEVFACTAVILREAEGELADAPVGRLQDLGEHTARVRARSVGWARTKSPKAVVDALTAEFDALLAGMQSPEVRAATRRAFDASPEELREAAMEAARRGGS